MPLTDPFGSRTSLGLLMRDPTAWALRRAMPRGFGSADEPDSTELTDEQEQGLLRTLGRGTLSGIGYVGGLLDKFTGSRALRGAIGGKPRELLSVIPGSDVLGITNPADIVEPKHITGWDDPTSYLDDIANFGVGVVLDPTLPFTGFLKGGISAAGKLASKAGVLDDIVKGTVKAGRALGPRQAKMVSTLQGALDNPLLPGGNLAARRALESAAGGASKLTPELLKSPLGGNLSYGVPFMEPMGVIGKAGGLGEKVARGMDIAGRAVRYSPPIRQAARLFSAPSMRATTTVGQEAGQEATRRMRESPLQAQPAFEAAIDLSERGPHTYDDAMQLYRQAEGIDPVDPANQPFLDRMHGAIDDVWKRNQDKGAASPDLKDLEAKRFFPRKAKLEGPGWDELADSRSQRLFSTAGGSRQGRAPPYKNIVGATQGLDEILRDPQIIAIKKGMPHGVARVDAIENLLLGQWQPRLPHHAPEDVRELAGKISGLPDESHTTGLWKHPYEAGRGYLVNQYDHEAIADTVHGVLTDYATNPNLLKGYKGAVTDFGKVIDAAGLDRGDWDSGAVQYLARQLGVANPGSKIQADLKRQLDALNTYLSSGQITKSEFAKYSGQAKKLANDEWSKFERQITDMPIPKNVGDDVGRFKEFFKSPAEVSELVKGLDSVLSLFKAGVLTWPARYVRDLMSSQVQNKLMGEWSKWSVSDAKSIVNGRWQDVDALKFPLVKELLDKSKLPHTPENARRALQAHLAAAEISGPRVAAESQVGPMAAPSGLEAMTQRVPGATPVTLKAAGRKLLTTKGWNPLNIRGVFGREETTQPIAAAGEVLGTYTDSLGRIAPYLNMLKRGTNPAEARARVFAAQVDYSNRAFAPFEREVMTRLVPFYKFTKSQLPFVIRELIDRPAGPLGQVVRGQAKLSSGSDDQFVPEHIRQTLSVPIPKGLPLIGNVPEGVQRYLTGFGLMHEDPISLLRPGQNIYKSVTGTLSELGGRLNPLAKAPIELATNRQLFTGREMQDLEGSLSRTLSNVGLYEQPPDVPILLEQALANSPLARLMSTARTISDPRKDAISKGVNLLTGVRIQDVDSEKSENIAIRESLEDLLRGTTGIRRLKPRLFVRKGEEELLSPQNRLLFQLYKKKGEEVQQAVKAASAK